MARVFSTRFAFVPGFSGGPTTVYIVPSGYIAVVKCITIVWGNVTVSGVDAWVQDDGLTKLTRYTWFVTLSDPTNQGGRQRDWGMWVFPEASEMQVQTAAGTVDFTLSGYLLTLP